MIAFEIAIVITACVYVTFATSLMIKELKPKAKQKKQKRIKTPEEVLFERAIRLRNVEIRRQSSLTLSIPTDCLIDKVKGCDRSSAPTYCKVKYEQAKIYHSQK